MEPDQHKTVNHSVTTQPAADIATVQHGGVNAAGFISPYIARFPSMQIQRQPEEEEELQA
jgi:hypothetical protein